MGLSTKLHRSLTLERSLPSRTFPKSLNKQQAAFHTHLTGNLYRKLDEFPATSEGKLLVASMESAISVDRGIFDYALRNDELRFVEAMMGHLDDLSQPELGAFWFTAIIGDTLDDGKDACDTDLIYLKACQQASEEYVTVAETSFDVVTYHWSAEMKKECILSIQHAWKFREMSIYALEKICE